MELGEKFFVAAFMGGSNNDPADIKYPIKQLNILCLSLIRRDLATT